MLSGEFPYPLPQSKLVILVGDGTNISLANCLCRQPIKNIVIKFRFYSASSEITYQWRVHRCQLTDYSRAELFSSKTGRVCLFNSLKMGQFVSTALTALGYPRPSFNDNVLLFKKISDRATTPSRGSDLAAGYDLYSAENVVIPKQGKALVKTDIAIALPEGCYGRVAPR